FVINGDAVVRLRPFVALSGAAPAPDQVAGLIELEYGWGLRAAVAGLLIRRRLVRRERVLPVDDPDVILRVNRHADGHPDVPVVRERLRPERINLEPGRHDRTFSLNGRHPLQHALTNEERDKECERDRADIDMVSFHNSSPQPGTPCNHESVPRAVASVTPGLGPSIG